MACNEYWPLSYDYNKDQYCMVIHIKPAQPPSCTKHIILIRNYPSRTIIYSKIILFMLLLLFCDTRFCEGTLFILVLFINWVFDFEIFLRGGTACQILNANKSYQDFSFLLHSLYKATALLKWISTVRWNKLICDPRVLKVVTCH